MPARDGDIAASDRPAASVLPTDRLRTLNEISRVLSSTLDLRALYETIYQQVGRVMGTTVFFIALRRDDGSISLPYFRELGERYLDVDVPAGPSVTRLVLERGTPLLFGSDAEYQVFCREHDLPVIEIGDREKMPDESEAMVYVPLSTGNRTLGVLSVQSTRAHAYTPEDVQTLGVIAAQAAVAIENARLYGESLETVRHMQVLLQVAQTISGSLDLDTVLAAILSAVGEVVPYYNAEILLPDEAGGRLQVVKTRGKLSESRVVRFDAPFERGITGKVFATGEPIIVPDVAAFPGYISESSEVRSEMAVPLKQGDRVIGVLNVEQTALNAFSAADLDLLSLFASQAAIAIENARLFREQQNRVFELQTIQSIVQKLTPLHEVPAIAQLIDAELKRLIDYHACRLFVLEGDGETLRKVTEPGELAPLYTKIGQGVTGWIAEHGTSVLIPDTLRDERVYQIAGTPRREESMIGAALVYQGKVRGVITLSKFGVNRFDENELRLLEIIAAQTAIALDRVRLYEELRTEAVTDPLTQLHNRRYLTERFREELARAQRNRHTLAAIMLDIDNFKRVNDTYGHDAGDAVLQDLAVVLRAVVRTGDIVARFGGEEFCVLLPETSQEDATAVAERLRSLIERRQLPPEAGLRHVTVSVGVALLEPDGGDTDLFARADLAMYEVKHRGGNDVCIALPEAYTFFDRVSDTGD